VLEISEGICKKLQICGDRAAWKALKCRSEVSFSLGGGAGVHYFATGPVYCPKYIGPAPVSLVEGLDCQSRPTVIANGTGSRREFCKYACLILGSARNIVRVIGASHQLNQLRFCFMASQGNGKTSIAEGNGKSIQDRLYSYCLLEVGGQIINVV